MTMFNSLKQNSDPRPYWIEEDQSRRTAAEIEADGADERFPNGGILYNLARWKPRPMYDNQANPVLLRFREEYERANKSFRDKHHYKLPIRGFALAWIRMIARGGGPSTLYWSEDQLEHALKVMARLAGVEVLIRKS